MIDQANQLADQQDWYELSQVLVEWLIEGNPSWLERETILSLALKVLEKGDAREKMEIMSLVLPELSDQGLNALVRLLDEPIDLSFRHDIILAMTRFKDPLAVDTFIRLLFEAPKNENYKIIVDALIKIGDPVIPKIIPLLLNSDTRLGGVEILANIGTRDILEPLLSVVQDGNCFVRKQALMGLINFHELPVLEVFLNSLTDPDSMVREEAVIGIGTLATRQRQGAYQQLIDPDILVNYLEPLLRDLDPNVILLTIKALRKIAIPSAAEIVFTTWSEDASFQVKLEILNALAWMEISEGLEYLGLISQRNLNEFELIKKIIAELGRIKNPDLKLRAAEILREMVIQNRTFLENTQLKNTLILGLGQLGDKRSLELLTKLQDDPDLSIQIHVRSAIEQLIS